METGGKSTSKQKQPHTLIVMHNVQSIEGFVNILYANLTDI